MGTNSRSIRSIYVCENNGRLPNRYRPHEPMSRPPAACAAVTYNGAQPGSAWLSLAVLSLSYSQCSEIIVADYRETNLQLINSRPVLTESGRTWENTFISAVKLKTNQPTDYLTP